MEIEAFLRERAERATACLDALLADPAGHIEPRLLEAMRYTALSGGKRIRAVLVLASTEAVGGDPEPALPFACAVEMVHIYSLIHDDLPAMDDDPVRRGRPSNHVVFGEAVAILAGDALLADAFSVVTGDAAAAFPAPVVVEVVRELAEAAGARGMVGGQTADLLSEGQAPGIARVESIHRRKTGALLRAAVRIGAILGGAEDRLRAALSVYGEELGLAFQIADDLLDATRAAEVTGKASSGRDRARGKPTVVEGVGIDAARTLLRERVAAALRALEPLEGAAADPLRALTQHVAQRAL